MKRVLVLAMVAAVLFIPGSARPSQATNSFIDQACISALKATKPNLTAAQRQAKCTVYVTNVTRTGGMIPNGVDPGDGFDAIDPPEQQSFAATQASSSVPGYWKWDVGNTIWKFNIEVFFHANRICAVFVGCVQTGWAIDSVNCAISYAYIVSLDITSCPDGGWRLSSTQQRAGAFYTTGYGPVTVGQHSYVIFTDPKTVSGIIEGTN